MVGNGSDKEGAYMDDNFLILMNRDALSLELLKTADSSLPRIMRHIGTCIPFAGVINGETIAVCLVEDKGSICDIVNLAVRYDKQHMGYGKEILAYVLDYLKSHGTQYVDTGCGNSDIRLLAFLQRAGFRFHEIWPDYYIDDSKIPSVENSIIRRDMVRFRNDLNEKTMETTGYDASGRTFSI